MANILLVEDDPVLGKSLKITFELESHMVHWVETLAAARKLMETSFELVILDLNLPDGSGLEFAQECQRDRPSLPILMLTASSDEDSVVAGLEAGAKDYVRKPFGNNELKARVRSILKEKSKALHFAGITILPDKRLVKIHEQSVELNRREFDILFHFLTHAENVVTRETLLRLLDKEGEIFDRTIDSHVSHLRARLKKAGATTVQISPVYGVGYRLEKKT